MVEGRMADLDVRLDDADRLGLSLLEGAPLRPHLDHADVDGHGQRRLEPERAVWC